MKQYNLCNIPPHAPRLVSNLLVIVSGVGKKDVEKKRITWASGLVNKLVDNLEYRRKWKKVSSIICDNNASAITVKTSSS